jgi:hypothetical protein
MKRKRKREMPKKPANFRVEETLLERARNAVWHVGRGLTLSSLLQDSLHEAVERLEREHNGGKPFPARKGVVPKGRKK